MKRKIRLLAIILSSDFQAQPGIVIAQQAIRSRLATVQPAQPTTPSQVPNTAFTPPSNLVNTGPGSLLVLFAAVAIVGYLLDMMRISFAKSRPTQ